MEGEPAAPRNGTWAFYIVLFVIITAAAIAIGMLNAAEGERPSSKLDAALMRGDLNVRIALAVPPTSSTSGLYARSAVGAYSGALPSPIAYHRIALVRQILLRQKGALGRIPGSEGAMWRRVYSKRPLSKQEAARYVGYLDKRDLGPLQEAAVAEVYAHAGMVGKANSALAAAREDAYRVVVGLVVLFGAVVLMGLAGVVVLSWFVLKRSSAAAIRPALGYGVLFPAFVAYLFSALIFAAIAGAAVSSGKGDASLELILSLVATVAAYGVGMWVLWTRAGEAEVDFRDIGLRPTGIWPTLKHGGLGYCAALPLMAIGLGIAASLQQTVFKSFQTSEHPIVPLTRGGGASLPLAFLLAVVVAPIVEETFFRGALYGGLRTRMGVWGAAAFSGALFASVHPTLPTGFLPILALGMVLAVLREKTGSLYPGMVCHGLNNAIMLIAAVLVY